MGYVDLNQNKRQDWITPPEMRDAVMDFKLIKLDVCTSDHNAMGAEQFYTLRTNGLVQPWRCGGLAWCNFPWSRTESPQWIARACDQGGIEGAEVMLLGPSRTDTAWFRNLWGSADAVCFLSGRITFIDPDTMEPFKVFIKKTQRWESAPCPVPTLLAYWGPDVDLFRKKFLPRGPVTILRQSLWWTGY